MYWHTERTLQGANSKINSVAAALSTVSVTVRLCQQHVCSALFHDVYSV